jgi:predicted ATP-dependent Lon-type protease
MEYEQAQGVIEGVQTQLKDQAAVQKAFSGLLGALYDEKKGAATAAKTAQQKIDSVDASYAMQLALSVKNLLRQLPGLYDMAKKFVPKQVREALNTMITYDVAKPALIAKDAYNARAKSYKFKQEAAATMSDLGSVMGGI